MDKFGSANEGERILTENKSLNEKLTYGREIRSVKIRKITPAASAYLPQQKTVQELAKKMAGGLQETQSREDEDKRKTSADVKTFTLDKMYSRGNYFRKNTADAEFDEIKAQFDELTSKISVITPNEKITKFEDSLNRIEAKIKHKWSFGGVIYAPKQVSLLYSEAKKIVDHSGSRASLYQIHNNIRDLEVNINKILELRSIQHSLLTLAEPKLKACKNDLDNYARTPASQDKIKAKLYDLMLLVENEQSASPPTEESINNWKENNSYSIFSVSETQEKAHDVVVNDEKPKFAEFNTFGSNHPIGPADADLVIETKSRKIEDAENTPLLAIQNFTKVISELKDEIKGLQASSDEKKDPESVNDDEVHAPNTLVEEQNVSTSYENGDNARYKDIESKINRLSETVDLLVLSLDALNNNAINNKPNIESSSIIEARETGKTNNKNFTDTDIQFFKDQVKFVNEKTGSELLDEATAGVLAPTDAINKYNAKKQFKKIGISNYLDDSATIRHYRNLISGGIGSTFRSMFEGNSHKLALVTSVPIIIYVAFEIISLGGVDVESIKNLDNFIGKKIDNIAGNVPKVAGSQIDDGKRIDGAETPTSSQTISDKSQIHNAQKSQTAQKTMDKIDIPKRKVSTEQVDSAQTDPLTDFNKGQKLLESNEDNKDILKAVEWLQKSARKGFVPAEYRLGLLYEKGEGIAKNYSESRNWYALAAGHGNIFAMHNLASMIAEGRGGEPNYTEAAKWYEKASKAGMRDSQYNLGVMYARAIGVPKDYSKSYYWFALAAKQGDEGAAKKRDEISSKLTVEELSIAKTAVDNSETKIDDNTHNTVTSMTQSKKDIVKNAVSKPSSEN